MKLLSVSKAVLQQLLYSVVICILEVYTGPRSIGMPVFDTFTGVLQQPLTLQQPRNIKTVRRQK